LVDGDRLRLYATDTGDFAPAEIARVKDELSHVFLDRSAPGVLDDFSEGMRRVRPDATCDACPHRRNCGRRFELVEGPPYAPQEAWIVDYIAGLRGRVLDVGCGEQLYQGDLAPLVRAGQVDYHGLDPDEPSLSRLRAALPEGHYHLGGIEQFRPLPAGFDRILCLRALNHVFDLDEAIGRMAEMLVPGGQLLLVECTPWAMLRDAAQVAGADRAPRAGHQHFRNVSSDEVLPLARRRGLRILAHQPAARAATNQWLLLLERPAPAAA
jgi:SAM-dependent methyltransferase